MGHVLHINSMNSPPPCVLVKGLLHAYAHIAVLQKVYQYFNYFCIPMEEKTIIHISRLNDENKQLWNIKTQPDSFFLHERHTQHHAGIDEILTHNIPPLKNYIRLNRMLTNYNHYFVIITQESDSLCVFRYNQNIHDELFDEQLILQQKKESIQRRLYELNWGTPNDLRKHWDLLLVHLAALHIPVQPVHHHLLKNEKIFRGICARYYRRFIFSNHILNAIEKTSFSVKLDVDHNVQIVPYFLEPSNQCQQKDLVTISVPLFFLYKKYLESNITIPNRLHVLSFFVYNHVINSFLIPPQDTYLLSVLCNHSFYNCVKCTDFYHVSFYSDTLKMHILSFLELFENTVSSYDIIHLARKFQRTSPPSPEPESSPCSPLIGNSTAYCSPPMPASPLLESYNRPISQTSFHKSPLTALLQSRPSSIIMETLPENDSPKHEKK